MGSPIFDLLKVIFSLILIGWLILACLFFFKYNQYEHYLSSVESIIQSTNAVPSNTTYIQDARDGTPEYLKNYDLDYGNAQGIHDIGAKNENLMNTAQKKIDNLDKQYGYQFTITPRNPSESNPQENQDNGRRYGQKLLFYVQVHVPLYGYNPPRTKLKRGVNIVTPHIINSNTNNDYEVNDPNINNDINNHNGPLQKPRRTNLTINYIWNDSHKKAGSITIIRPLNTPFDSEINDDLGISKNENIPQTFGKNLGLNSYNGLHIVGTSGIPANHRMSDSHSGDTVDIFIAQGNSNKKPPHRNLSVITINYDNGNKSKTIFGQPGTSAGTKIQNIIKGIPHKGSSPSNISSMSFPPKDQTNYITLFNS